MHKFRHITQSSLKYESIPSSSLSNLSKFLTAHLHHNPCAVLPKKYISTDLSNPDAAVNVVRKIISSYMKLADMPFMGTMLQQSLHLDIPFRYIISGNYLIFYKVTENIEIHRIIYGRRDYIRILFPDIIPPEDNTDAEQDQ